LINGVFIGYGQFGQSLLKIFDKVSSINWYAVISPNGNDHPKSSTKLPSNALQSDFTVIACPDPYHLDWILLLSKLNYKGYVFCEKSPVTNLNQLDKLSTIENLKIYYNFPLLKTSLSRLLSSKKEKIKNIDIKWVHNLASKQKYRNSWRSNASINPFGVGTSLAVHFIHLSLYIFGKPTSSNIQYLNIAGTGSAPDTVNAYLEFENGPCIKIECSYAQLPEKKILIEKKELNILRYNYNWLSRIKINFDYDKVSSGTKNQEFFSSLFIKGNQKSVKYFMNGVKGEVKLEQDFNVICDSLRILFESAKKH
jgi:predicted dehydrogenase